MPAAQVELYDRNKALQRIVNLRHGQEIFWMRHKAMAVVSCAQEGWGCAQTDFVILSSIDRSSRINVGRVTLDRSAPGRSCDMICERTNFT